MPRIRVTTPYYPLSHALATTLSRCGHDDIVARVGAASECKLIQRRGTPFERVAEVLRTIAPFQIDSSDEGETDADVDIDLVLGSQERMTDYSVSVFSDSETMASAVCARLNDLGFRVEGVKYAALERDVIMYGGALAPSCALSRVRVQASRGRAQESHCPVGRPRCHAGAHQRRAGRHQRSRFGDSVGDAAHCDGFGAAQTSSARQLVFGSSCSFLGSSARGLACDNGSAVRVGVRASLLRGSSAGSVEGDREPGS